MKYVILSLRSMGAKLYIMLFVLVISFFMLLLFYGEVVRNHHFILSMMYFTVPDKEGQVLTSEQWEAICRTFEKYDQKIEGDAYATITLSPEGEEIYSSQYFFQGGENSFTEEQYRSCAKIIKTSKKAKKLQIGSTWFTVQHWDSKYSEIPITTVVSEQLPVWNIEIVSGCMGGKDYKSMANKMQKILPSYRCTVTQMDQIIQMEWKKTYLFFAAVLVSIFNVALIYQYIVQEQRYHIVIYRLCGSRRYQLYFISLIEIMLLFAVSFAAAMAGYYLLYSGMYRLGIVSLRNTMSVSYVATAGILCGIITVLFLLLCSTNSIRRPVKELYVERE